MTPDETVILARYVRALCPAQRFDEYTPDAWHDVLGDYRLSEARTAAAAVAARHPFVSPAEIITEIRRRRANAAADYIGPGLPAAVPDADPDNVPAYLAALREQRTRAADGQQLHARPVAALTAQVGRQMPAADIAKVRRPGPHGTACPTCHAAIGRPCRLPGGKERGRPHPARVRVAQGLPATTETADEFARQALAEDSTR